MGDMDFAQTLRQLPKSELYIIDETEHMMDWRASWVVVAWNVIWGVWEGLDEVSSYIRLPEYSEGIYH